MHNLTESKLIWNRACLGKCQSPRAGDKALTALLVVHGIAMNSGLIHAIGRCSMSQLSDAESGYRFFDLGEVAEILLSAHHILIAGNNLDTYEVQLDAEYHKYVPNDGILVAQFEHHLQANPFDFAPL